MDYYLDPDEPPGRWWGKGRDALGLHGDVEADQLRALLEGAIRARDTPIGRGFASAAAALGYQHVIDGQDAEIVRYLEKFRQEPAVPAVDRPEPPLVRTQWARDETAITADAPTVPDQDFRGGDDGTRTHDPLLAKQVL